MPATDQNYLTSTGRRRKGPLKKLRGKIPQLDTPCSPSALHPLRTPRSNPGDITTGKATDPKASPPRPGREVETGNSLKEELTGQLKDSEVEEQAV